MTGPSSTSAASFVRPMTDPFGRNDQLFAVSVTTAANLRCFYCMSEE